ncbi:MAG: response regulator transcription factor [Clostridiales bacterium]|nr:response regulator transcription factor [Clostridiales bacterium]MBQ6303939.1 response regulator transcription factor [Clostridiales bacterium]
MVLVVEDDSIIAEGLKLALTGEGMEVTLASSVSEAYAALENDDPGKKIDFCLLDMTLPDGNGMEICTKIRETSEMPIIFLTAMDDEIHTVLAFDKGADDYISKPFHIKELIARMKRLMKRNKSSVATCVIGANKVDITNAKMYRDGNEVPLTAMEYKLLLVFINHAGEILDRDQILNILWDDVGSFVNDNTLTVYIKRLRSKLGDDEGDLIETLRGQGYRLNL